MEDECYKAFEDIMVQDPRSATMGLMVEPYRTMEAWYAYVDSTQLNSGVPVEVRRNFDRAKNLSLYAWYVYDFHQVAEMDAISTLEMALRKKFEQLGIPISFS